MTPKSCLPQFLDESNIPTEEYEELNSNEEKKKSGVSISYIIS